MTQNSSSALKEIHHFVKLTEASWNSPPLTSTWVKKQVNMGWHWWPSLPHLGTRIRKRFQYSSKKSEWGTDNKDVGQNRLPLSRFLLLSTSCMDIEWVIILLDFLFLISKKYDIFLRETETEREGFMKLECICYATGIEVRGNSGSQFSLAIFLDLRIKFMYKFFNSLC